MKAVVCTKYGPPDVIQLKEIEKPTPKNSEVLIKIHTSSVTAGDVRIRSFSYAPWFWLFGRMIFGFTKPKKNIPGDEFAGEIVEIGSDVRLFKKGDQVFGMGSSLGFGGGNAEYKSVPENGILTIKPTTLTYEEVVVIPFGGSTALHFLNKANIQKGQKVLINGASGGVGTFAVQLAKYFGAEVTGVCSTRNLEMVKSLGADKVIDYNKEDFTKSGQTYDVIYDTVMKTSFSRCKSSLKPRGIYLTDDWPLFEALWTSITKSSKKLIFGIPNQSEIIKNLVFLKELVEAGKIKPVIDRRYPLEQIVEAHKYVDKGHKRGNVIITVEHNDKT